jgi:hypothetical protein
MLNRERGALRGLRETLSSEEDGTTCETLARRRSTGEMRGCCGKSALRVVSLCGPTRHPDSLALCEAVVVRRKANCRFDTELIGSRDVGTGRVAC